MRQIGRIGRRSLIPLLPTLLANPRSKRHIAKEQAVKTMLVAVFPDERSAYAGSTALQALHGLGDITLHESTIIVKEQDGTVKMRAGSERPRLGILLGMVGGGLIGGLGGPVAAIAGAFVGIVGGLVHDVFGSGLDVELVDEVGAVLEPGNFGVIADLDENGTSPVDTRLAAYGGRVLRQVRGELVGGQLHRQTGQTAINLNGMTS